VSLEESFVKLVFAISISALLAGSAVLTAIPRPPIAAGTPCENLKSISLPNTTITISEFVAEQQVASRGGRGPGERGPGSPVAGPRGPGAPFPVDVERGAQGRGPAPRGAFINLIMVK
jgi:hypothetical protein